MNVEVEPGKYVVAVSGGVDSVVLLDLLSKNKNLDLVVVHFDHGMRKNSDKDCKFVEQLAVKYKLPFIGGGAKLGNKASEEIARHARYDFLNSVLKSEKAKAIVTAHHQDDVNETIILNILRGTGRKGITSLKSRSDIIRPLINFNKNQIKEYATKNKIDWVEDPTNQSLDYSRNWVRHKLIPKLSDENKNKLLELYNQHKPMNAEIDKLISKLFSGKVKKVLDKNIVIKMEYRVASELVAEWLRTNELKEFDKKTIDRIVRGAKTLPSCKRVEVYDKNQIIICDNSLVLDKYDQSENK